MKITIESTTQIVQLWAADGTPRQIPETAPILARVWKGYTESGIEVQCLIPRIAAPTDADRTEFERELEEQPAPPPEVLAFPLKLLI